MNKYIITTDDTTDLPLEYYSEHNVPALHLSYVVNDVIYDGVEKNYRTMNFIMKFVMVPCHIRNRLIQKLVECSLKN